jgi:hypothetical protein
MRTTLAISLLLAWAAHAQAPAQEPSLDDRVKVLEQALQELREQKAAAAALPPAPVVPDAGTAETPADDPYHPHGVQPFAFGDFSWMPGNYGGAERPFSFGPFTGELRVDVAYHYDLANPIDNTIGGSSEVFRSNEFQLTQMGFGGDFYYRGVMARLMTQFGMYSVTTPRNDPSTARGNWDLSDAYRYISEAYGGYHFNVLYGINVQAGIFMSYVGLWSYYNFDNWTYQPSYVSSNTPWFFNGARVQIYPTEHLKLEPWLVNGWQSYGKFNTAPGVGLQIMWRPTEWFAFTGNQYFGTDTLGNPQLKRIHTDDSVMARFYNNPDGVFSRLAGSLTLDAGCEFGTLNGEQLGCGDRYFLGFMAYVRAWFFKNTIGATVGGGAITNPGLYLVLVPPINGATAFTGSPYFPNGPHDKFDAWDMQLTADWSPVPYVTFRFEYNHRASSVPYFTGHEGITPPGGNTGSPGSAVPGWAPDLVNSEDRLTAALLVKI